MVYERQYYTNGDVLNAEQLNHMEAGIKENSENIDKLSEDIADLKENGTGNGVTIISESRLKGHTMTVIGDSLSVQTDDYQKWYDFMSERVGGMTISVDAVGGRKLVAYPTECVESDIICVWGGTNDWTSGVSIGEDTDKTVETFKGALHVMCSALQTSHPNSRIVFITPIGSSASWGASDPPTSPAKNGLGLTIEPYVDAIIDICSNYKIPVVDLYRNSGMNPENEASNNIWFSDGLHLYQIGQNNISYLVESELLKGWIPTIKNSGDGEEEPTTVLESITCVFTQGDSVFTTESALNDLKNNLVVTAHYSDGTTKTVTNYSLSGTLTQGNSIITVKYGGKTATFIVSVVSADSGLYYPWAENGTYETTNFKIDITNDKHFKIECLADGISYFDLLTGEFKQNKAVSIPVTPELNPELYYTNIEWNETAYNNNTVEINSVMTLDGAQNTDYYSKVNTGGIGKSFKFPNPQTTTMIVLNDCNVTGLNVWFSMKVGEIVEFDLATNINVI